MPRRVAQHHVHRVARDARLRADAVDLHARAAAPRRRRRRRRAGHGGRPGRRGPRRARPCGPGVATTCTPSAIRLLRAKPPTAAVIEIDRLGREAVGQRLPDDPPRRAAPRPTATTFASSREITTRASPSRGDAVGMIPMDMGQHHHVDVADREARGLDLLVDLVLRRDPNRANGTSFAPTVSPASTRISRSPASTSHAWIGSGPTIGPFLITLARRATPVPVVNALETSTTPVRNTWIRMPRV